MKRADRACRKGADRAGRAASLTALGTLLGTLLVPKCPLCIAAFMTALGFGAASSHVVAPLLRPLLLGAALIALATALAVLRDRRLWSRRREDTVPSAESCCFHHAAMARSGGRHRMRSEQSR